MGPIGHSDCDPETLRRLFLFKDLSEEQLATLCRHATVEEYEAGPLFFEGHPATSFFVLIDGDCRCPSSPAAETSRRSERAIEEAIAGAVAAFWTNHRSATTFLFERAAARDS